MHITTTTIAATKARPEKKRKEGIVSDHFFIVIVTVPLSPLTLLFSSSIGQPFLCQREE
jgi:hypothetical protein